MALVKQIKDKGSHTLVTFTIGDSSQVLLLGDFNDWQENDSASQMKKKGNSYVKSIKLKNGKRYEFRYLSEANGWFNDSAADDYAPSPFEGIENGVVDLSVLPKQKKAVKKVTKRVTKKVAKTAVKKTVKKKVAKTAEKDDLKKIEGIGPKIASILTAKGIPTFQKLSKASVSVLENILKEAGPRYSMHKPGSWPQQAKLADEGKWEELKKLQDKLNGGRL